MSAEQALDDALDDLSAVLGAIAPEQRSSGAGLWPS